MSININKTGIFSVNSLVEQTHIESDGSKWVKCFYHNNPTANKFSVSDTFSTEVIKPNLFFNFNICESNKINNKYEFLVIQKATSSSTEIKKRWTQTNNPISSTTPGTVVYNTATGYTSANSDNGLYRYNSNTYLITKATWWGAIGCWTEYQGGIPGFNAEVVKDGYIIIYYRIPDNVAIKNNEILFSNNFYEI